MSTDGSSSAGCFCEFSSIKSSLSYLAIKSGHDTSGSRPMALMLRKSWGSVKGCREAKARAGPNDQG